jgi:hypothetical protein
MHVRRAAAASIVALTLTITALATTAFAQGPAAPPAPAAPATAAPAQLGALAPANLAKPRPKPPFDLTGLWLHAGGPNNSSRFSPPEGFTLTKEARAHYDAARKAQAEGRVYRDDIGQCWPAGLPVILTRVWPIAMVQLPTVIYMTSEFMNSLRIIYLDGHWLDSGIPISDAMHMVERIRKINDGKTLEIAFSATDPKSWEGTWTWTKRWNRVDDRDIAEVSCYPDLNEHMPSTKSNVGDAQ